ncbi:MAG: hypothetical protein ACK2T3_09540, partial [Candidatus Promineifilaceae bacterium]
DRPLATGGRAERGPRRTAELSVRKTGGRLVERLHASPTGFFGGRGADAVVRHGAFIRENVIILEGGILGHASEAKNSIMLHGAHAPHFNYIGDSILGAHVNLGAGTKLSNLTMVSVKDPHTGRRPTLQFIVGERLYDTGLAKLGAILGDDVQTGCNAVLNPGCLVGPRTIIYANVSLRKGYYEPDCVQKLRQAVEGYNLR